mmetsp:Transcript_26441/g.73977  ORF Transcript_26441/g.73977 Transcript_26441/m.73977 type:complete len:260 (-) Transcript_26441:32-811(-)
MLSTASHAASYASSMPRVGSNVPLAALLQSKLSKNQSSSSVISGKQPPSGLARTILRRRPLLMSMSANRSGMRHATLRPLRTFEKSATLRFVYWSLSYNTARSLGWMAVASVLPEPYPAPLMLWTRLSSRSRSPILERTCCCASRSGIVAAPDFSSATASARLSMSALRNSGRNNHARSNRDPCGILVKLILDHRLPWTLLLVRLSRLCNVVPSSDMLLMRSSAVVLGTMPAMALPGVGVVGVIEGATIWLGPLSSSLT